MGNIAKQNLQDKDMRNLEIKPKQYVKAVGNPKELYIWVNPSGKKTFSLRYNGQYIKLKEFREGIYSVYEARKDAIKLLKELESGKDIDAVKGKSDKYKFKNLFKIFIDQKRKKGISETYLSKISKMNKGYILPKFGEKDVKTIKYSELLEVFNAIFNPSNPRTSRLETIHRLINHLHEVFAIAIKDRYIDHDPSFGLNKEFPTSSRFNINHQIDSRYAALTQSEELKAFLQDLKADNRIDLQTKRAIYLQILCINRPINTTSAKWADLDLENSTWTIQANEMKAKFIHKIALSTQAIKIFKEQRLFCHEFSKFVFPAINQAGHLHRDTISKAIRNLGGKDKYKGIATSHGFRATFRTICSTNKAELYALGITEEAIESMLAHKEFNQVKYAYEREKATMEQKAKLMQWYADYLESIEPFGF